METASELSFFLGVLRSEFMSPETPSTNFIGHEEDETDWFNQVSQIMTGERNHLLTTYFNDLSIESDISINQFPSVDVLSQHKICYQKEADSAVDHHKDSPMLPKEPICTKFPEEKNQSENSILLDLFLRDQRPKITNHNPQTTRIHCKECGEQLKPSEFPEEIISVRKKIAEDLKSNQVTHESIKERSIHVEKILNDNKERSKEIISKMKSIERYEEKINMLKPTFSKLVKEFRTLEIENKALKDVLEKKKKLINSCQSEDRIKVNQIVISTSSEVEVLVDVLSDADNSVSTRKNVVEILTKEITNQNTSDEISKLLIISSVVGADEKAEADTLADNHVEVDVKNNKNVEDFATGIHDETIVEEHVMAEDYNINVKEDVAADSEFPASGEIVGDDNTTRYNEEDVVENTCDDNTARYNEVDVVEDACENEDGIEESYSFEYSDVPDDSVDDVNSNFDEGSIDDENIDVIEDNVVDDDENVGAIEDNVVDDNENAVDPSNNKMSDEDVEDFFDNENLFVDDEETINSNDLEYSLICRASISKLTNTNTISSSEIQLPLQDNEEMSTVSINIEQNSSHKAGHSESNFENLITILTSDFKPDALDDDNFMNLIVSIEREFRAEARQNRTIDEIPQLLPEIDNNENFDLEREVVSNVLVLNAENSEIVMTTPTIDTDTDTMLESNNNVNSSNNTQEDQC